jgi:hypothetical protein
MPIAWYTVVECLKLDSQIIPFRKTYLGKKKGSSGI